MTAESINLERVYALVVGIEKYQAGADLSGAARDALNFAGWLLERGVRPEHIYLFLSPIDQNVLADAKDRGLQPIAAGCKEIESVIREQLTSKDGCGDLLHVFWGGHGFITKTDATTRRLVYADTSQNNQWNLDFNSLLEALSTSVRGAGFKQQYFWIDACADKHYQDLYEIMGAEAAASEFSASGEQLRAEQFVLFAAGLYKVAVNEANGGRFARVVLEELQEKSLAPPEMKMLAEKIQGIFRERGQLEPVYFWSKGSGYEEEDDRLKLKDVVVTQKNQRLSEAQQLKLQYLQTKRDDLLQDVQIVQAEIAAVIDVLTARKLERRLDIIFENIEQVNREIEQLAGMDDE